MSTPNRIKIVSSIAPFSGRTLAERISLVAPMAIGWMVAPSLIVLRQGKDGNGLILIGPALWLIALVLFMLVKA